MLSSGPRAQHLSSDNKAPIYLFVRGQDAMHVASFHAKVQWGPVTYVQCHTGKNNIARHLFKGNVTLKTV